MIYSEARQKSSKSKKKSSKMAYKSLISSLLSVLAILQLFLGQSSFPVVQCQDFEDLKQTNQQQLPQHTFQPLNRQQVLPSSISLQPNLQSVNSGPRQSLQRPILSSRFAPIQPNLAVQASSNLATFQNPQQLPQQFQQIQPQPSNQPAAVNNIEQLMKNALARTAKLNSDALEPRQDNPVSNQPQLATSIQAAPVAPAVTSPVVAIPAASGRSAPAQVVEKVASASETFTSETASPANNAESSDQEANLGEQLTTTSGHETVYSDQRFANLFARRNNLKKSKLNPTEQIKAKPTLPAFIKSPPDPKQFSGQEKPLQPETSNVRSAVTPSSFGSQRNQSGRLNQNQKNKAAAITSTSAASASNKRANALASNSGRQSNSKALASATSSNTNNRDSKPTTSAKVSPTGNNPFNKSQQNNNDPANVIAMARKRLLAGNSNESAKLKQQQQQQQQSKPLIK